jgi:hypothetical protein
MAAQYKHKRYWELHQMNADSSWSAKTFTGTTAEAYAEFSFPSVWNTGSPTITYAFADSNATLVVTYEFADEASQTSFKTAVDTAYGNDSAIGANKIVKHKKTEWLHQDDSVSATDNDII